jgi:predicted membrane channel-forming protein YqfA (hemolysin III family)
MLGINNVLQQYDKVELLAYVSLIQLWWVAIWGISFIVVEYLANRFNQHQIVIYIAMLLIVFTTIIMRPNLIEHL